MFCLQIEEKRILLAKWKLISTEASKRSFLRFIAFGESVATSDIGNELIWTHHFSGSLHNAAIMAAELSIGVIVRNWTAGQIKVMKKPNKRYHLVCGVYSVLLHSFMLFYQLTQNKFGRIVFSLVHTRNCVQFHFQNIYFHRAVDTLIRRNANRPKEQIYQFNWLREEK